MFNNAVNKSPPYFAGLTMDEVLGHAILFMLVGYDTTSNALTFTAYNLATNPECQEKLIDEIDTVLGKVRAELMILFTGKYKPQFYFRPFRLRCQRANLIYCLLISPFKYNYALAS